MQKIHTQEKNDLRVQDPFVVGNRTADASDEDASEEEGHDRISAQQASIEATLTDINHALEKISAGTYGVCENCKAQIPEARLLVLPHASLCVACQEG